MHGVGNREKALWSILGYIPYARHRRMRQNVIRTPMQAFTLTSFSRHAHKYLDAANVRPCRDDHQSIATHGGGLRGILIIQEGP